MHRAKTDWKTSPHPAIRLRQTARLFRHHALPSPTPLSGCSKLVYIELLCYFVPTAVLKKELSGLRDWWKADVGTNNTARQYQTGVHRPGYYKIIMNTYLLSDHATRHAPCKDTTSPKLASTLCHLTPLKNRHKFQIFNAINRYLRSHILSCRIPLPHQQSLINHVARHISSSRLLKR